MRNQGPRGPPFLMQDGRPFHPRMHGFFGPRDFPYGGRGRGRGHGPPPLPPAFMVPRLFGGGAGGGPPRGPLAHPRFIGQPMHGIRMMPSRPLPPPPSPGFMGEPEFRPHGPMMHRGGLPSRARGIKRKRGGGRNFQANNASKAVGEFQCDTCDRSYETRKLLDEHIVAHKTCGIDGCSFAAHPKVVELHVKFQHDTGLAARILKLGSAEEIEKWKGERKKNYPTVENVVRRQVEQADRLARGELLQDKQFGKFKKMGRGRDRGRARGIRGAHGGGGGGRGGAAPETRNSSSSSSQQVPSDSNGTQLFQQSSSYQLMGIADPGYISFEDETPGTTGKKGGGGDRPPRRNGRGGFRAGRGRNNQRGRNSSRGRRIKGAAATAAQLEAIRSGVKKFKGTNSTPVTVTLVSAEGGLFGNSDVPSQVNTAFTGGMITDSEGESVANGNTQPRAIVTIESDWSDDSDVPQELSSKVKLPEPRRQTLPLPSALASLVAAYESSEAEECVKELIRKESPPKVSPPERTCGYVRKPPQRIIRAPKPTLLEMLLAKEIRHERNVILQCVRHIVKNNFFDADVAA